MQTIFKERYQFYKVISKPASANGKRKFGLKILMIHKMYLSKRKFKTATSKK